MFTKRSSGFVMVKREIVFDDKATSFGSDK